MTKAVFSTCLLLALASVTFGEDPSMEVLHAQYRRQLMAKVGPRYGWLNLQALVDAAGDVAKAVFSPHADLLKAEAEREFRALPRYDDAKLSGFATKDPLRKGQIEASIAFLVGAHLHTPAVFPNGWSPKETARRAKQVVVSRLTSAQTIGQRTLLEKFIPDEYYRFNDDYANPTVVVRSLDELFLVTLKLKKSGVYTPVKLEWLARTPEEKGAGGEGIDPAKRP